MSDVVSGAGNAPPLVRTIVVTLYDADERVRHVHTMHLHEGAAELSEAAAVERARHHARELGHEVEQLRSVVSTEPGEAS